MAIDETEWHTLKFTQVPQKLLGNLIKPLGYISRSSGSISFISTIEAQTKHLHVLWYKTMTSLPVLSIALLCVLYINSKISCVDSRPPDNLPIAAHIDDVTDEVSGNRLMRKCTWVKTLTSGWIFGNIDLHYRQNMMNIFRNRSSPCWGESSTVFRVYVDVWGGGG